MYAGEDQFDQPNHVDDDMEDSGTIQSNKLTENPIINMNILTSALQERQRNANSPEVTDDNNN